MPPKQDAKTRQVIELIARWMKGKKTGSLTINFNQGGITTVDKREKEELK